MNITAQPSTWVLVHVHDVHGTYQVRSTVDAEIRTLESLPVYIYFSNNLAF